MDELLFLKSITIDESISKIESKYTINIVDDNAKSYPQGMIRFNTTILQSNTDSFSVNDSDILIPMTTVLSGPDTVLDDATVNNYILTVKNSFYDYIYSYSIKLNGTPVETEVPFSNLLMNFKLYNESTANNNVTKSNLAFSKNTGEMSYSDVASGNGKGECMNNTVSNANYVAGKTVYNTNAKTVYNTGNGEPNRNKHVNEGFLERCEMLNLNVSDSETAKFISDANCSESRRSYFKKVTDGGTITYTYSYYVIIPLNSFSFMKNLAMITAPKFEIALRVHTSTVILTSAFTAQTNYGLTSAAAGSPVVVTEGNRSSNTMTLKSVNSMYEYTPFMVGDEFALKTKGNGDIKIVNSIGHVGNSELNSCYLRCGMIAMSPQAQLDYYNVFGKLGKKMVYEKYLSTIFYEQQCGSQFRHKITTNASKILGLVVQTVLSRNQNGGALGGKNGLFTCLDSPFNASLNVKNCSYINLNIRIGDKPIFPDNINYTYETYKLMSDSFLNGGISRELPTSIISKHDFDNGYGYLFFDLSHRKSLPTWNVDNVIELTGKLNMKNNIYCDIYYFLITEETIRIDPSTSQLLVETD